MRERILIAIVICTVLAVVTFGFTGTFLRNRQQAAPLDSTQSLRQRASLVRHATAAANPRNLHRYDDVAGLTRDSAAIVVGSVGSMASALLPPQDKMIVTDYRVTVLEVLKGVPQPGQTISVRAPGGRVQFDDGTSAEVTLPDYWKNPEVGKTYILFLEARPDGYFVLTGEPQGLFEVTPEGNVTPQARAEDKLMRTYNGKSKTSFIAEIQKALIRE